MGDDKEPKKSRILILGDYQNISSEVVKHLGDMAGATEIVEPIKFHYGERSGLSANLFFSGWTKYVSSIRIYGGYRYRHVRIDVAAKKERKHKMVPRFLERVRGEEMFPLPFHRDEWGDVYFPKSVNPIFD